MSVPTRAHPPRLTPESERTREAELLSGLRRGVPLAAAALYSYLLPTVTRTVCRVHGHIPPDVDDLIQATFERIVRTTADGTYDGAAGPLYAWASMLARRTSIDALRRHYREKAVFASIGTAADVAMERRLQARSELHLLRKTLARLTPERAEAILLHDGLGYDLVEMAQQLEVSPAAAQSRLVRGRTQLFKLLRAHEQCDPCAQPDAGETGQ